MKLIKQRKKHKESNVINELLTKQNKFHQETMLLKKQRKNPNMDTNCKVFVQVLFIRSMEELNRCWCSSYTGPMNMYVTWHTAHHMVQGERTSTASGNNIIQCMINWTYEYFNTQTIMVSTGKPTQTWGIISAPTSATTVATAVMNSLTTHG